MILQFYSKAWEHYLYWQKNDKQVLKKINALISETCRTPFEGSGKPEQLKYELSGIWSRRINQEHRLVYSVEDEIVTILSCRFHYN